MTIEHPAPARRGFLSRLAQIEDGTIVRYAFFALLAGTACVLYIDYSELGAGDAAGLSAPPTTMPVLPAFEPEGPDSAPRPDVTTDSALLEAPMTIELSGDGILQAIGTIAPGTAERFAEEVEKRGSYVRTVSLSSPGGSVEDAIAIGKLIREKGFGTEVAAGALCASSCPLVFVGGVERQAEEGAAIGVHQVYASIVPGQTELIRAAGTTMAETQRTTARITRHLSDMGVDPAIWLHALETPPEKLYYFSPDEMTALRLVTNVSQ